ncbi:DUF1353 domain-containing protein [Massilia sp. TSP1-1-2]|uniref:DUF1353 domain-containing protein n=1 Tax=Massilia sp. TSP1-1-2 TaxID=2804649 RepID=UPI003CF3C666
MSYGAFSGNPKTMWLSDRGDDRDMQVIEDFWYLDQDGRRWDVPAGTVINGASIPRTLWSSVGSPYTGNYRRAALVHDAAVGREGVLRAESDAMFYFACLAGGCSQLQAKMLYAGVRLGAWASNTHLLSIEAASAVPDATRLPGEQTPRELEIRARYTLIANQLKVTGNDFAEVEQVVDRNLGRAH